MATNTKNFNFKLPDESDFYDVQDQNSNWEKADQALQELDTPAFEDYTGETPVPAPETALGNIKSKGKLSVILSNIKAFAKGCCTLGMLVNDCVTDNPKLPLSAAQGKALMDLYTVLNTKLAERLVMLDNGSTAIQSKNGQIWRRLQMQAPNDDVIMAKSSDSGKTWPEFERLLTAAIFNPAPASNLNNIGLGFEFFLYNADTINSPYKAGLTGNTTAGGIISFGYSKSSKVPEYACQIALPAGITVSDLLVRSKNTLEWGEWKAK